MTTTHPPTPALLGYVADGEHSRTALAVGGPSTPGHPDTASDAYQAGAAAARVSIRAGHDPDHLLTEYAELVATGDHNAAGGFGHTLTDAWAAAS